MYSSLANERGFSLAEVMVAFAILTIGMAGVGTMVMTSVKSDQRSFQLRDGSSLALQLIEQLKSEAIDTEITETYGQVYVATDGKSVAYGETSYYTDVDGHFAYKWEVTRDSPTAGMDMIEVLVAWGGSDCKDDIANCLHKSTATNFIVRND